MRSALLLGFVAGCGGIGNDGASDDGPSDAAQSWDAPLWTECFGGSYGGTGVYAEIEWLGMCQIWGGTTRIELDGVEIASSSASDFSCAADPEPLFVPWPDGTAAGVAGVATYRATSGDVVAEGTETFVADPTKCVELRVQVACAAEDAP